MAFMRKVGSLLSQTLTKNPASGSSGLPSPSSFFNVVRHMSSARLFIGGLSWSTDDESLRQAFSQHGQVIEARVILERNTGRSKGFGFVRYGTPEEAAAALEQMHGADLQGRSIRVEYAQERPRGFGGFGIASPLASSSNASEDNGYSAPEYGGKYDGDSAVDGHSSNGAHSVNEDGSEDKNSTNSEFGEAKDSKSNGNEESYAIGAGEGKQ